MFCKNAKSSTWILDHLLYFCFINILIDMVTPTLFNVDILIRTLVQLQLKAVDTGAAVTWTSSVLRPLVRSNYADFFDKLNFCKTSSLFFRRRPACASQPDFYFLSSSASDARCNMSFLDATCVRPLSKLMNSSLLYQGNYL